jgi:putative ATP-binding cassette transporter
MVRLNRSLWRRLTVVARPFFVSSQRWRAAGALAGIVTLLLALNALNVANSYIGRNFMSAISLRDHGRFKTYAVLYLVVFASSTAVAVTEQFVQDRLALSWRDWLTRQLLGRYLGGQTVERLRDLKHIDNPDQRIAEDVRTLTSTLLSFVVMIVNGALTTIAFAGVLWSIAPVLLLTAAPSATTGRTSCPSDRPGRCSSACSARRFPTSSARPTRTKGSSPTAINRGLLPASPPWVSG